MNGVRVLFWMDGIVILLIVLNIILRESICASRRRVFG